LTLIKERAERDKQEREALESLKMSLEAQKRKVEDELVAERALTVDKDALLERSKKREGELEDEVSALQADLDLLDSQLDRAMKLQKESEEKYDSLRTVFDQAAEHLVRLETDQKDWVAREAELTDQFGLAQDEIDALRGDVDELHKLSEELKNLALQREEDLARAKERMDVAVRELEGRLDIELRNKLVSAFRMSHTGFTDNCTLGISSKGRAMTLRLMHDRRKNNWLNWLVPPQNTLI
jgi:myosin heavy chain 9/10/11/14